MKLRNWHRMWLTHRNEGPGFLDVSQVVVDERGKGSRGQIVLLVDGYIIGIIVVIIWVSDSRFSLSPRRVGSMRSKSWPPPLSQWIENHSSPSSSDSPQTRTPTTALYNDVSYYSPDNVLCIYTPLEICLCLHTQMVLYHSWIQRNVCNYSN